MLHAITGASGLLGSHLAEMLVKRGESVRAIVRPNSNTAFLESLGVQIVRCELTDARAIAAAVDGADRLYHTAAKVGDWGTWQEFKQGTIETARNVVNACRTAHVGRLLHVSSVLVYGHPRGERPITEEEPLGQHLRRWDYYARSKIAAEQLVAQLGPQASIIRPTWIYGPRDRSVLPRILLALRKRRVSLVGDGGNLLNMVHVADVAEGAILAAQHPSAAGQAYNLGSRGEITQRGLLDALCQTSGLPPVTRKIPLQLALAGGLLSEVIGRSIRLQRPPYVTRHGVSLISRRTQFSSDKAHNELGWQRRVEIAAGLEETLAWLRERSHQGERC